MLFRSFNFWNGIVSDLGEDGAVIEIYACFVPEINFTIILSGMMTDDGVLRGKFNDVLNLPAATKNGYTFAGWCVADRVENEIFKDSSVFALGSDFQFTKMPDLSFNREEDGTAIYLSAKFTPNTYMVSFETMYGCQVAATTVTFGSVATFDVPSAIGRQFAGWYYVDESGNKRQIADHNGRLTNLWNIDKNVRLYPEYNLITYRVHYEGLSSADSLFNIESDAFDLPKLQSQVIALSVGIPIPIINKECIMCPMVLWVIKQFMLILKNYIRLPFRTKEIKFYRYPWY